MYHKTYFIPLLISTPFPPPISLSIYLITSYIMYCVQMMLSMNLRHISFVYLFLSFSFSPYSIYHSLITSTLFLFYFLFLLLFYFIVLVLSFQRKHDVFFTSYPYLHTAHVSSDSYLYIARAVWRYVFSTALAYLHTAYFAQLLFITNIKR